MLFNKKVKNGVETKTTDATEVNSQHMQQEEWVLVEGYKATDENCCCRGHHFDIGVKYVANGKIEECENGFHLCLKLSDVFNYYQHDFKNRFFKVNALVRKQDVEEYSSEDQNLYYGLRMMMSRPIRNKLVAKEITFVEEVTHSKELYIKVRGRYKMVEDEDEFNTISNYTRFVEGKFLTELRKYYSELFARIVYDSICQKCDLEKTDRDGVLMRTMKLANALAEENVSHDIAVYLLAKAV